MTSNAFLTIWFSPRETVRRIVSENPSLHVTLLACLFGVSQALDRASMRNAGDKLPLPVILGVAVVLGPLGGLLAFWIYSHLVRWTGRWIGGTATRETIKTALAWGFVPVVCSLPLWILELLLFGSELFQEEMPRVQAQPLLLIPLLGLMFIELSLGIWSFVLTCNTVAEVQGFRSAWRGFGNILLGAAVVVVPLVLLALVAFAIKKL